MAPHANQFVDPMMLLCSSDRNVGFLIAKKSYDKVVIGAFAKALGSIPVTRAQDMVTKGAGTVYIQSDNLVTLRGKGTKFTSQLKPKSTISIGSFSMEVISVNSDTEAALKAPVDDKEALAIITSKEKGVFTGSNYTIMPHVNQSSMFAEVTRRLLSKQTIGIFPEGGSHDRTEMLPLKPGVAIMAFEALSVNPELKLAIVPVGLHYFQADQFRSRAVLEYGDPISIPQDLIMKYLDGGEAKRECVGILMDTINVALKALTVQAPSYENLMAIQAARRLYSGDEHLDIDAAVKLSGRFAYALEKMKDNPKVQALLEEVKHYNLMLDYYGVRDHQVKITSIKPTRAFLLLFVRMFQLFWVVLLSLPMLYIC